MFETNINRKNRWFDGGLAASGACCFTHPLDLLKVHLQTAGGTGKLGIVGQTAHIIRSQGALAMFNGLSASVLRNLTYSTTRFAIYGNLNYFMRLNGKNRFSTQKILLNN